MIWWLMVVVVVVVVVVNEDDVMTTMTTTMKGSRGLWEGEEKDDGRWMLQTLLNYIFFYFFQEDPNRFPDL